MTTEQRPQTGESGPEERWLAWLRSKQRPLTIAGGVVVVLAGAVWFGITAKERRETFARRELDAARVAAEAGNLPLAANDLSRVASTYGGTRAGQEARLLLAQVRLLQGQAELAVTELRDFIAAGPMTLYRAPAQGILGTALEQVGQLDAAGQAYEQGAQAAEYSLVAARLLLDAGRAYMTAADSTAAIRVYQQILERHGSTGAAGEALLRLAELRRFDQASPER